MAQMLNIDLEPEELSAYSSLKNYLLQSKHSSLQRREYTKPGEFHFYDACSIEPSASDKIIISNFRSGPDTEDFHFQLHEQNKRLRVQILISHGHPDLFIAKVKEIIRMVGKTANERSGQGSHPVATPFGYSLWSSPGGKKTVTNFEDSVSEQVFSRDFSDYCLGRTFCLKFRETDEDEVLG